MYLASLCGVFGVVRWVLHGGEDNFGGFAGKKEVFVDFWEFWLFEVFVYGIWCLGMHGMEF